MPYNPYEVAVVQNNTHWLGKVLHSITNNRISRTVSVTIGNFYEVLVVRILARLYLLGPNVAGYGFWEGRPPEDICSSMSGNSPDFWRRNMEECQDMIGRRFHSWMVFVEVIIYILILYKIFKLFLKRLGLLEV